MTSLLPTQSAPEPATTLGAAAPRQPRKGARFQLPPRPAQPDSRATVPAKTASKPPQTRAGEDGADQTPAVADRTIPHQPDPAPAAPATASIAADPAATIAAAGPVQAGPDARPDAGPDAGPDAVWAQRPGPGAAQRGAGLPRPEAANKPAPARADGQPGPADSGGARSAFDGAADGPKKKSLHPAHVLAASPNRAAAHLSAEQPPQPAPARAAGRTALRPGTDSGRKAGTAAPQGEGQGQGIGQGLAMGPGLGPGPGQPQMHPFRMESPAGGAQPRGPSAAGEAAAHVADVAAADMGPADVIVGAGRADGIAVTIAAATPDLRDRFRSAAGDLRADLARLGTEVDSIHVALRAGMSADAQGSGQTGGEGRSARDHGLSGTGLSDMGIQDWATQDRATQDWATQDWATQDRVTQVSLPEDFGGAAPQGSSAPAAADAEAEAADPAQPDADSQPSTDEQTAGNERRGQDPEGSTRHPDERFRFAFSVPVGSRAAALSSGPSDAAPLPGLASATRPVSPDANSRNRIDRYA